MEGHERKHVEERLKLLRNIQTMLNASAALMSQYQAVVANLPPIPIEPQIPDASSSACTTATTVEQVEQTKIKSERKAKSDDEAKLEDLGSEESFLDSSNIPGPSKHLTLDNPSVATSSTLETELSSNGDEEANEIRKRRLQKFAQSD